jgi:4-hydroxy-tetrahydrodipicolinate synthase
MFKGSIPALVTPFRDSGEIDYASFDALVQWHVEADTDALVICGITGECPTLTAEENQVLIARAVRVAQGAIPIIAGTGCASTRLTVEQTERAQKAGADGCLVIVPYCNRPTVEGCMAHYQVVSQVGLPMIVYHHPSRTNVKLPVDALVEILSLPHVVGVKEGSADLVYTTELCKRTNIPLLCGDDILTPALMGIGARGVISIVANVIPQQWKALCAHFLNGNFTAGRELFRQYQALIESLTLEINPQCVKYALSLLGKCKPHMRLPLLEPRAETKRKIEQAIQECSATCFENAFAHFGSEK